MSDITTTATATATTTDHDQWLQYYHLQSLMDAQVASVDGFSDATVVTTMSAAAPADTMILSPSSLCTSSGQLTPKGNVSKPIRRRSRASKKTPTTLLNANTTNFRALVQQFTGCPNTTVSLGVHRGPITLNFQQGSRQQIAPLDDRTGFHHQVSRPIPTYQQAQHQQQQQQQQQISTHNSVGSINNDTSVSMSSNLESSTGFPNELVNIDGDTSLHDMTMGSFCDETRYGGYFMG